MASSSSSAATPISIQSKYRGAFLGMAAGDALGTTFEFKPRKKCFKPAELLGGGAFRLLPGQWTDDTSLACCLAESLCLKSGQMELNDQLLNYWNWYCEGHMSANGRCFDIGTTTRTALNNFEAAYRAAHDPSSSSSSSSISESMKQGRCGPLGTNGNGSLMRLAPAPLAIQGLATPKKSKAEIYPFAILAARQSAMSSLTTHGHARCVEGCAWFGWLLAHTLHVPEATREAKEWLLTDWCGSLPSADEIGLSAFRTSPSPSKWNLELESIVAGSYRRKSIDEIVSSGDVLCAMEAALWCFWNTNSFAEGASLAASLGDDSDTVAAVYGQIAGAFYGAEGLPDSWKEVLFFTPLLEAFGNEIYRISSCASPTPPSAEFLAVYNRYMHLEKANQTLNRKLDQRTIASPAEYDALTAEVVLSHSEKFGPSLSIVSLNLIADFQKIWAHEKTKHFA